MTAISRTEFRQHISPFRSKTLNILLILGLSFLSLRLFSLHVLERMRWQSYADHMHQITLELPAERGMIFDRNGKVLATSKQVASVYAVPYEIKDAAQTAAALAPLLNQNRETLRAQLEKDKSFVWIERHVTDQTKEAVENLTLPGIGFRSEYRRFYPQGTLLAPVLGFCNIDEAGIEGLELRYESFLAGEDGYRLTRRDALGRAIPAFEEKFHPPLHGHHVFLAIDQFIQFQTEQTLAESLKKWHAKSAMAVVMDPMNGAILAMASLPSYDPNQFMHAQKELRKNRTVTDYFEPGSTLKFVTASAALETGTFKIDSKIHCEGGAYRIGNHTLHDVKPYNELSFSEVFIKSSNIGTVKIAQKLGNKKVYEFMRRFGLGERAGKNIPGEIAGVLTPPERWSSLSIGAVPIGHEIGVTVLQMVRAISVIANGGYLVKPYLVKEIRDHHDTVIEHFDMPGGIEIIPAEIAESVNQILKRAVEDGTGKNARIPGIPVAGKTGTAQKLTEDGKTYSHDRFTSSFIGYAPADQPRFALMVVIDEPKGQYYGGTVAAPVFKKIMEVILLQAGLREGA